MSSGLGHLAGAKIDKKILKNFDIKCLDSTLKPQDIKLSADQLYNKIGNETKKVFTLASKINSDVSLDIYVETTSTSDGRVGCICAKPRGKACNYFNLYCMDGCIFITVGGVFLACLDDEEPLLK